MRSDAGSYSRTYDGKGQVSLTYYSPEGRLEYKGSESACDRQLDEWKERYQGIKQAVTTAAPAAGKVAYLALVDKELAAIRDVIERKNNDYTGASEDPFANFRVTEALGLSDARTGVLIRMVDKIQRLKTFIAKGELKVTGESAQDAARDIIGYSLVLLGMLEQRK